LIEVVQVIFQMLLKFSFPNMLSDSFGLFKTIGTSSLLNLILF